MIARRRKFDSISSTIRGVLHWLPIRQRVDFKLSVFMFICLRNLAPSYLMNMCQPVTNNLHRRRLHSAVRGDLIVPSTKTVRYGPRSFAVAGLSTWNALPAPLCNDELSAMSFLRRLNYTWEHIIHTSTLVTVFTVWVGEHNFIVLTYLLTAMMKVTVSVRSNQCWWFKTAQAQSFTTSQVAFQSRFIQSISK